MLYVNPLDAPHAFEHGPLAQDAARRRVALQEMEQYFARLLLREMRATIPEGGLFPRSAVITSCSSAVSFGPAGFGGVFTTTSGTGATGTPGSSI